MSYQNAQGNGSTEPTPLPRLFPRRVHKDGHYRAEAEDILRSRAGFFYLRNRPQFTLCKEDVEGHDPFRKFYVYGDEGSAAEDMAFVLFQVWKFPVDSRFYVTAAAFSGKHDWEQGCPID